MTDRTPTAELVPSVPISHAERLDRADDAPALGSWWWVFYRPSDDEDMTVDGDYDESEPSEDIVRDISAPKGKRRRWLGSVVKVGSNYVDVEGYCREVRIALDDFHTRCVAEPSPGDFVRQKVDAHRDQVKSIMGEVRELCHRLGVPIRDVLPEGDGEDGADDQDTATALAILHGTHDARKYQNDLVMAKKTTLPELFKRIESHHKRMAEWMRVEMIPSKADLERVKGVTSVMEAKISTVELYAGLAESVKQVRKGKPAALADKVHLMQRRHYMDEECLARYEAGGMSFEHVGEFDKWLARDENLFRLFPHPRTVVAFRIRRYDRKTEETSVEAFIALQFENQHNKQTFLYIRNGNQLWRVETEIEFDEELFPNKESTDLLSDTELWINSHPNRDSFIRTRRQIDAMRIHYQMKRKHAAWRLWQWHRAGCPEESDPKWTYTVATGDLYEYESYHIRKGFTRISSARMSGTFPGIPPGGTLKMKGRPGDDRAYSDPTAEYRLLTPDSVYFDDAMARMRAVANEHNRLAVIIQGLLHRSTCLHPHPPWEIWKPEGFAAAIELAYDVSLAIETGKEPIDFEAYRRQLNQSIRAGCYTLGQYKLWSKWMATRFGSKWREYAPGGWSNNGPAKIARVVRVRRNGNCVFEWTRERQRPKWARNPERPGYMMATYPPIPCRWEVHKDKLTCIDAYTPGDYRMFFDDHRTRESYMQWAPILLSAENWHHKRRLTEVKEAADAAKAKAKSSKPKAAKRKPEDLGDYKNTLEGDDGYADACAGDDE